MSYASRKWHLLHGAAPTKSAMSERFGASDDDLLGAALSEQSSIADSRLQKARADGVLMSETA
jgi:hypothetical protein